MSNENANGNGKGEKDFFVITYGRQYLDSTLRQENDYYVNDWENYKKVANEKGDYVEFEEAYVEKGNVKYKKIKRRCPMSEYEKEINNLNKSSDLNKSNVNENASASPENNAVLTLKNEEKDEEDEITEIKVSKDKGNEEEGKKKKTKIIDGVVIKEEKENKNEIVEKAIKRVTGDEINVIIKGDNGEEKEETIEMKEDNNENNEESIKEKEGNGENEIVEKAIKRITGDETNISIKENNEEEKEKIEKETIEETIEMKEDNNENNEESIKEKEGNGENEIVEKETIKIKENNEEEKEEIIEMKENNDENQVSIEENNSSEVEKNSETEDKNEDEEEIEINLENITLSSFESEVYQKEIDDLNKANALNENNTSEDKDKDHEENDSGEKEQNDQNDRRKDVNSEDEENGQKTEIVKLVSETKSNIDKNQKKGMSASNSTLNIALLVDNSEPFADFCEKLTGSDKNIDLSKLDFGGVSLCFLNCCRAFFLTLFDGLGLNGFWNRLCLRVFFENARSKGKSYCFEVPKIQNDQSQDSNTLNKPQYEQNICWLSSAIDKVKQQTSEKAGIDVNNRNPDKQQLH